MDAKQNHERKLAFILVWGRTAAWGEVESGPRKDHVLLVGDRVRVFVSVVVGG